MKTIIVEIPSRTEHGGYPGNLVKVEIPTACPECNNEAGLEIWRGLSYDGSRRLNVDCWSRSCEHNESYRMVRQGIDSGRNKVVPFDTRTTLEEQKLQEVGNV